MAELERTSGAEASCGGRKRELGAKPVGPQVSGTVPHTRGSQSGFPGQTQDRCLKVLPVPSRFEHKQLQLCPFCILEF